MALRLATWSARRVLAFWGAGLVLEAVLLIVLSVVLVRPEPPLVALLRGDTDGRRSIVAFSSELRLGDSAELRPGAFPPPAADDSFYTVLHWPLDKPLTAGGGRVVAVPMRFWWVPALYIFGVPLLLIGLTGVWLWTRSSHASAARHSLVLACCLVSACAPSPMRRPVSAGEGAPGGINASLHHCADSATAFRRVVAEFQSRQQNVAISVGVRQRGRTVFREATGFANKETRLAASPSMAFSIASISKAFTGAALLKLVEEGRIDLDAEVQRYVPDFPRHPSGRPVTIRLLAHHLSGLRHWGPERNEALYARHFTDVRDILALFKDSAWVADLATSTRYSYSSYGYNALAMAIQSASGISFQRYLSQTVLEPLELRSVQFDRAGLGGAQRPARYSWYDLTDFHDLTDAPQRVPDWDYTHNMAGGGLIANVDDLLTFGSAMRTPGLLSSTSIAQVWTRPSVEGIESPMSFGWFPRTNPPRISISGSNAGVQAGLTVWKDEDLVVAVLANSWGRSSRSGELMDDSENGLIGKLAAVCGAQQARERTAARLTDREAGRPSPMWGRSPGGYFLRDQLPPPDVTALSASTMPLPKKLV